jgi:hypothetical protein
MRSHLGEAATSVPALAPATYGADVVGQHRPWPAPYKEVRHERAENDRGRVFPVLHGVIVHADGVTAAELPGSTVLLLTTIERGREGVAKIDVTELDLPKQRVLNLAPLVRWAVANGY